MVTSSQKGWSMQHERDTKACASLTVVMMLEGKGLLDVMACDLLRTSSRRSPASGRQTLHSKDDD